MALDQRRKGSVPARLEHARQQRFVAVAKVLDVFHVEVLRFCIKDCSGHCEPPVHEFELPDTCPSRRQRQAVSTLTRSKLPTKIAQVRHLLAAFGRHQVSICADHVELLTHEDMRVVLSTVDKIPHGIRIALIDAVDRPRTR